MSYLSVLPLTDMKVYLRIDDSQNETDAEITAMINAALSFIEKATNHIMYARDIDYFYSCGNLRIYDFPINSTTDTAHVAHKKSLYTLYCANDSTQESITFNVGYADPVDVPAELIEAAKQMVKVWYFEAEKQANTTLIPMSVQQVIDVNRRFLL